MKFLKMLLSEAQKEYQPGNLVLLRKVAPSPANRDDEYEDEWESGYDEALLIYSPKYTNDQRGFVTFIKDLIDYMASGQYHKDTYGEEDFYSAYGQDADSEHYDFKEMSRIVHQYLDDGYLIQVPDDQVEQYTKTGIQMEPLEDGEMHAIANRLSNYDPIANPPKGKPDWSAFGATDSRDFLNKFIGGGEDWKEHSRQYNAWLNSLTPEERAKHIEENGKKIAKQRAEDTARIQAPQAIKRMKAGATAQSAIQKAMQSSKKGKFGEGVETTVNKEGDMNLLRSLMEAAKPAAEKSPISKSDMRTYQSQVKTSFKGDAKFKEGKVSRSKFAAAAMDCIDNCPKNGNCDEKHKSAAVKAMWAGYRAKHDGVKEGFLAEGWDESSEDPDVRAAEDEVKKRGIKTMSKRAEKALHKRLEKGDKRDENSGVSKVNKAKEKSKEEVTESVTAPAEPKQGGFAEFLKQK